jgi:hypothetical protein
MSNMALCYSIKALSGHVLPEQVRQERTKNAIFRCTKYPQRG